MKALLALFAIGFSFLAQASVDVSVSCLKNNICDNNGTCRSKVSYSVGRYIETQGIKLDPNEGVELILKIAMGEIVVTSNVYSEQFSLGNIDLSKLNCVDQDRDFKKFQLIIPTSSSPRLKVIERGSICWDQWDGAKWVNLKNEKYGITFGSSNNLFFKTDYVTVLCN
jgi:hypothetical protein